MKEAMFNAKVGDDVFGRQVVDRTAATGVGVDAVLTIAGQRTATYLSLHQPDGEVAMAVNDMDILESLTPEACAASPALSDANALLLVDCNLAQPTLVHLLGLKRKVVVDGVSVAKCRRLVGLLAGVYLLKLNHLEASALSGLPVDTPEQCLAVVQHFLDGGVERVIVSHGASGLAWGQLGSKPFFRQSRKVPK